MEIRELINLIRSKNNPRDLFYDTRIEGTRIWNPMSSKRKVALMIKKMDLTKKYK